jgi:hypothetical protein
MNNFVYRVLGLSQEMLFQIIFKSKNKIIREERLEGKIVYLNHRLRRTQLAADNFILI